MKDEKTKRFSEWTKLKATLDRAGHLTGVSEGQVWWAAVGENVGVEINGKSDLFSRPVIVYKKLSKFGFLAIPLTSQKHEGSWYVPFTFQGKINYAVLAQVRVMSIYRLYEVSIGKVSTADFKKICQGFDALYHFEFKEHSRK